MTYSIRRVRPLPPHEDLSAQAAVFVGIKISRTRPEPKVRRPIVWRPRQPFTESSAHIRIRLTPTRPEVRPKRPILWRPPFLVAPSVDSIPLGRAGIQISWKTRVEPIRNPIWIRRHIGLPLFVGPDTPLQAHIAAARNLHLLLHKKRNELLLELERRQRRLALQIPQVAKSEITPLTNLQLTQRLLEIEDWLLILINEWH